MSDELTQLVRDHVDADEVVEMCRDLVRAPSENPPGNEEEVAAAAEAWLSRLGLTSERVTAAPGRPNVLASWGGTTGKTLLFNGHYDVVPAPDPDEWPHPPFSAAVADGKIYGRGTSDMKAGIAACLGAVSALRRAGLDPKGRLLMQFVADEETLGTWGTKHLVDNGYCDGVDECLVGEPTALNLVPAERGAMWFRIHTRGVSAHGSTPQLGVNAIEHMAHVIRGIGGMRFRKLHELLGSPSVNIGTISGGSKVNTVPDRCTIEIDRRTLPGETVEEVTGEFQAVLDALAQDIAGLRAEIELDNWAEACETPPGTTMVDLLAEGREALGVEGYEFGYMGATDARFIINQASVPAVIFGPGDIHVAHTTGEAVEIEMLVEATRIYAHAFARFLEAV